ncbi:hypothetical protein FKM82_030299 [Ascaphus truei]
MHNSCTPIVPCCGICWRLTNKMYVCHDAALTTPHRLAEITGRPMRVVGWYHSHPHITVWPSHVDVRTQAMYQMMDVGFVGLIFSCFIEDKNTKVSVMGAGGSWTEGREDGSG